MGKIKHILHYLFIPESINRDKFIVVAILFASLIVASNYLVQFYVISYLTFAALLYPMSFLISSIISENHDKKDVLKAIRLGLALAIIPSAFSAPIRIVLASIIACCVSQIFDVVLFYALKKRFFTRWYVRSNSAGVSLTLDSLMFFHIAFLDVMPYHVLFWTMFLDFMVKISVGLCNNFFFYIIAIRSKQTASIERRGDDKYNL